MSGEIKVKLQARHINRGCDGRRAKIKTETGWIWQMRGERWCLAERPLGQSRQRGANMYLSYHCRSARCARGDENYSPRWDMIHHNASSVQAHLIAKHRSCKTNWRLVTEGQQREVLTQVHKQLSWLNNNVAQVKVTGQFQGRVSGYFLKSYWISSGYWRTNYLRKEKLDILQEEDRRKTVILTLRTDARVEGKIQKQNLCSISYLHPVETQSPSAMGQLYLKEKNPKVLQSSCNWAASHLTTRLQHSLSPQIVNIKPRCERNFFLWST